MFYSKTGSTGFESMFERTITSDLMAFGYSRLCLETGVYGRASFRLVGVFILDVEMTPEQHMLAFTWIA